jgi:hypothetical protein
MAAGQPSLTRRALLAACAAPALAPPRHPDLIGGHLFSLAARRRKVDAGSGPA